LNKDCYIAYEGLSPIDPMKCAGCDEEVRSECGEARQLCVATEHRKIGGQYEVVAKMAYFCIKDAPITKEHQDISWQAINSANKLCSDMNETLSCSSRPLGNAIIEILHRKH
jgi:hypothetical protein